MYREIEHIVLGDMIADVESGSHLYHDAWT